MRQPTCFCSRRIVHRTRDGAGAGDGVRALLADADGEGIRVDALRGIRPRRPVIGTRRRHPRRSCRTTLRRDSFLAGWCRAAVRLRATDTRAAHAAAGRHVRARTDDAQERTVARLGVSVRPRRKLPALLYSSIGGHAQIRFRSPYGLSMRPTLGQNLCRAHERQRKRRLLARVRVRPVVGRHGGGRVRRVLQDVVRRVRRPVDDRLNLPRESRSSHRRTDRAPAFGSLSVGSIISVPATGNDTVGAWNP